MKKTALITGASRGIGAEIARTLARDGWSILVGCSSSLREAEALASDIGGGVFHADISDASAVCRAFESVAGLDLLVNNAGIAHYGLITDMSPGEWDRLLAVNVTGMYNMSRCAIPLMLRQKRGGIINVSSVWGTLGASCEAAYSASKAAIIGFSRSLAKELGPSGIRVNCVAPGVIDTKMLLPFSDEERRELIDRTPLGRLGSAADVAQLVAFLASDESSFITGQVIGVDGGFPA